MMLHEAVTQLAEKMKDDEKNNSDLTFEEFLALARPKNDGMRWEDIDFTKSVFEVLGIPQ